MTEGDVASTIDFATRLVCLKLGLRDFELITEEAMLKAIGSVNPTAHQVLVRFITAYREWFKFGKTCEEGQKTNSVTPADYQKLGQLMNDRESSRKALMSYVHSQA